MIEAMKATLSRPATAAEEAQRLFFEIGMSQRVRVGARLAELGLSFPQALTLRFLEASKPLPMSVLAERLFCDASNVTGIADRLESRGVIERLSPHGDRRVKALALTPACVELREQVVEIMSEPPPSIAALSERDQRALRDILRRAVEHLRAGR
jgi:DNA-binding MarR family transcriptional regulator